MYSSTKSVVIGSDIAYLLLEKKDKRPKWKKK